MLQAFRLKMRNDAVAARSIVDPETYEQQTKLGREVADIVRRNVVQGVRVSKTDDLQAGEDTYRIRLTKHTELGSNDTIKNPPPVEPSNRNLRRREKASQEHHTSVTDVAPHNNTFASFSTSHLSMNFSKLKKAYRQRVVPELKEEDLEETFVRGSGPGGQSVNKTENNVQLLHKPSGIRVSCQESRSLKLNRMLARRHLLEKVLDKIANPGLSKQDFENAKQRERERRRRKKAKRKAAEKSLQEADEAYNIDELDLEVENEKERVL
ncbi:hypothetical protein H0H93_007240 [Arthromyces matolae]|nr:hypothetical protein H0H93_007240 [Arthromyces matolae]